MPALTGLRRERAVASKQYRDGGFRNTYGFRPELSGNKLPLLNDFLFGGRSRRPTVTLPVEDPREAWATEPSSGLRVTWLGHSTMLLESAGLRVLTDPVFGLRASPLSFAGPKRFHPTPVTIEQLPELDLVLVSHDHHDHLCPFSVRALAKRRVPFVTSLGVGAHLERYGVEPALITELDWWEQKTWRGGTLAVSAAPSQHFSGRGLLDRNQTLWSSWVIQTDAHRLFFSGDTGLTDEFVAIRERFGSFDLTMLEVGAWHPAWGRIHLGPANALSALEMLGGGTLLPVHWGTFDLGLHPWDEPAETLLTLAEAAHARVLTPKIGRPFEPSKLEGPTPWWRGLEQRQASSELAALTSGG